MTEERCGKCKYIEFCVIRKVINNEPKKECSFIGECEKVNPDVHYKFGINECNLHVLVCPVADKENCFIRKLRTNLKETEKKRSHLHYKFLSLSESIQHYDLPKEQLIKVISEILRDEDEIKVKIGDEA